MIKTLYLTGYKNFELGIFDQKHPGIKYIKTALRNHLVHLLDKGLQWVLISGQLGVELWGAEVVLELKDEYPQLQLAVITPFLEQEQKWQENTQEYYHTIVEQADYVNSLSKRPYEGPWQFKNRNRFMLEKSDAMLLVYDEENEGSPKYIMDEALKKEAHEGYERLIITADDLQMIVDEIEQTYE